MKDNERISVLMFQFKLDVTITPKTELCNFNDEWYKQFSHSIDLMNKYKPDVVIYPETCYNDYERETYEKWMLRNNIKLLIAGSTYTEAGKNKTVIFENKGNNYIHVTRVCKNNPSPLEVASKYMDNQSFQDVCINGLKDMNKHLFKVKGKTFLVLNCMEYYNSAYYMGRRYTYGNEDLFGILCPCSSNNIELFKQETIALNNHKENIYTFLCNRISTKETSTTKGKSYIYGRISRIGKQFLKQEYPSNCNLEHVSGIAQLDDKPSYIYGEYAINNNWSPFGRSDNYRPTPENLKIGLINI